MEQKEKELQPQTRAYTVEEIAAILHIGRSSAYTRRWWSSPLASAWPEATISQKLFAEDAVKRGPPAGYVCPAARREFLVDKSGNHYFIEMNPRIQVELPLTEMVTGIDPVRAQIPTAEGHPLSTRRSASQPGRSVHERLRLPVPGDHRGSGPTTSPPDTGRITAYRSGWRLRRPSDGGNAFTARRSPLLRLPCWSRSPPGTTPSRGVPQGHAGHQRGACPRRQDQHPLRHQHSGPPHLPGRGVPHQVH